jgi:class I fructose-bisphosphate aldolase
MHGVLQAGAKGATIGRNVWGVPRADAAVRAFKAVLLDGASVEAALSQEGFKGDE